MLIKLNYITEDTMRQALSQHLNIPFIHLEGLMLAPELRKCINKVYAKNHRVVPVAKVGSTITVAMDDPTNRIIVEDLQASTGCHLTVVTSTSAGIMQAFAKLYGEELNKEHELELNQEVISEQPLSKDGDNYATSEREQLQRADEIVRKILDIAIKNRTSDIHIESHDHRTLVKFRIDGVLQELHLPGIQESLHKNRKQIVSRIKILGKLDISEKRRPQDGSFRVHMEKQGEVVSIDFRISIIPGYHGENVVLRILDPRNAPKALDDLGLSQPITERLHQLLRRPTGILLITGPTGSGKSSTLYAALTTLYRPEIKILTAENPSNTSMMASPNVKSMRRLAIRSRSTSAPFCGTILRSSCLERSAIKKQLKWRFARPKRAICS